MAKPARQPQPQLKIKVPVLEAADLAQLAPPEAGRNLEDLPPEELQVVEDKINDLQNFVFSNFQAQPTEDIYKKRLAEQKAARLALRGLQGVRQFENTLEMYRGRFAGHMLSDSAWGLIFAALGPVGTLLQDTHHKKIAWQYAWGKNFLNPQAIFFYLKALPEMKAFKFITHPVKKTIELLARSKNPLFSAHHYLDWCWNPKTRNWQRQYWNPKKNRWQSKVSTIYGFTPFLAFSKSAEKLADYIDDRLLGVKWLTDKQGRRLKKLNDPRRINHRLTGALKTYEKARKDYLSSLIIGDRDTRKKAKEKYQAAQKSIFQILKDRDDGGGLIGLLRNSLFHPLKRASKNLRNGNLLLLLGNLIWDVAVGVVVNTVRYLAARIVSRIPALARVRAKLTRFFTSRRWLSNVNMGRQTFAAQAKALISLNTFSGGFLGAQLMSPFGTQAMYAGGFLGGVVGWQYQALLHIANNPTLMEFARYPQARAVRALGRLGAPGPMLRTAYWLKQNPWLRLPLKGIFLGQLAGPFLKQLYGINPTVTFWTSTAINYFWASRAFWIKQLLQTKLISSQIGKLALRYALPHNIMAQFMEKPFQSLVKIFYENTFKTSAHRFLWRQTLSRSPIGKAYRLGHGFINHPLTQKFFKNILANPGFFMGFELISLLHAAGLPWLAAIPLGPIAGGLIWNIGAFVVETITGVSKASLSSLGWIGFTIGWLGEIIAGGLGIPLPSWWSVTGLTLALPFSWGLVYGFGKLLSMAGFWSIRSLIGFSITSTMEAMLGASLFAGIPSLAALVVPGAIILIGGLAIFTGFVVFASMWVPFSSTTAATASDCFTLNLEANKTTLALNESVETCATYTILPNPLLLKDPRLQCAARLDPRVWELENNWTQQAARASRQLPGESLLPLTPATQVPGQGQPVFWQVLEKNYLYSVDRFPFKGGAGSSDQQDLNLSLSVLGNDTADGIHISGQPLGALALQFPQLQAQIQGYTNYLNIIQNHPDPQTAKDYLITEYQAQLTLLKDQQSEAQKLIKTLNNILDQLNKGKAPADILDDLEKLLLAVNLLLTPPTEPEFYYQSKLTKAQDAYDACSVDYTNEQEISSCEQHYDQLISIYESFPDAFRLVPAQIDKLINLAELKDTDRLINELAHTITSIEDFVQTLPASITNLEALLQQIKDIDLDNLFAFLEQEFYYLPGGTIYKICYTATLIDDIVSSPTQSFECTANEAFVGPITRPTCQVRDNLIFNNP